MKKFLIAGLAVLGVLVGAILVVPSFIDWNAYKAEIAERVSAATGRAVDLKGDIGLSLLPSPALTVRDARLANAPGASEADMARLKELDVRVALGPLLSGRIQVQSIRLIDPTFVFEVLPDGRFNWDLSGADRPPADGAVRSGDGIASSVSFDQVTVQNGTILYRDARDGRSETLEHLDARIVAGSFAGPFQGQGSFRLRGVPLRGEAFVSRLVEGAAVQVRAALSVADTDATLRFAGIVTSQPAGNQNSGQNGGTRAQGDLRAEGSDLARALEPLRAAGTNNPALAQPFSVRTAVEASAAGASFTNLEGQLGDTRATGNASLRTGTPARAEVTLALNRLDLDAWLDRAGAAPAGTGATAPGTPRNGGGATAPKPAPKPAAFALPTGLDAKLDLAVDGITYNGGVVRQGRVEASLADGKLAIDRISALLPGGSDFVAAGELAATNGQPNLDLRMEANADNLRALLEWLKVDVRAVPADRLRRASLAATVQGRPDRLELGGLDLRVDTSRVTGAIAYVDRGRPAFGARLDLDRLNLDAYLPQPAENAAPAGEAPANAAGNPAGNGKRAAPMTPARLLAGVDANLDLTVGHLTVRGLPVQGLRVDATANGGALTIKEAKVDDLAGLKARVDGQIAGLSPLRGAHLTLSAEAASLAGLSRAISWPAGAPSPERLGAVKTQGRLSGDAERMAVELNLEAAGGSLDAGGTLLNVEKDPGAELKLRARHPDLAQLAALFGDGGAAGVQGPLDLYTELTGNRKAFTLSNIQGTVAGTSVQGRAATDLSGPKPRVEAEIQTGDIDIERLTAGPAAASRPSGASSSGPAAESASASSDKMDFGWLRSFDGRLGLTSAALLVGGTRIEHPALRAAVQNGVLTVEQFDGGLLGGQIGATGRLAAPGSQPPTAEATITVAKAKLAQAFGGGSLDIAGGTLDMEAALTATGATRDAMLKGLNGQGRLAARDGVVRGFDLGALRDRLTRIDRPQDLLGAVLGGLQGGETRFARLDGSFAVEQGVVRTHDTRMTSDLGEATAIGQVSLPAQTIDMRVRLSIKAEPPLPPLAMRLTGPLDKPTRSFEMQEIQEYFARRAADALLNKAVPKNLPVPGGEGAVKPDTLLKGLFEGLRR